MGADDPQQALQGALEALDGSAVNRKLHDLLGWNEATDDAGKAPLIAASQRRSGRRRRGDLFLEWHALRQIREASRFADDDGNAGSGLHASAPLERLGLPIGMNDLHEFQRLMGFSSRTGVEQHQIPCLGRNSGFRK